MAQQQFNRNPVPIKGLYTSAVADSLGPEYTPWCQNVRFRFGQILKCPGRSVPLQSRAPKWLMDFARHTDAAGVQTIFGLEASNLADGAAVPYNPATRTFGTSLVLPQPAQLNRRFNWTQGEEQLLVVRGSKINAIHSAAGVFSVEAVDSPVGQFIEYFKNHVMLTNIQGNANRIQWSARAQYNDWATTTGHGGFLDLYDGVVEEITNAKILGDRFVVYRNSSITDIAATGDDTNPFLPEGRVYGIGCMAPWTLVNVGQFHIFLGNDYNMYAWDGVNLNPIGTPIHSYIRQLYDSAMLSNWTTTPFAAAFMSFKEYWLVISQQGSSQYVVLIYDYLRDTWSRDVFSNLYALFEQMLPGAVGTAGYNPVGFPLNYPTLMGSMNNDYFMIDERIDGNRYGRPADGGIDMWVDTPDMFYSKETLENATLQRVMVSEGQPHSPTEPAYQLQVSIDRGNTFPVAKDIQPLDTHWGFEFVDENITSNVRRYRFMYLKERGASFPNLRAYSEIYVPAGEFFATDRPIGATLVDVLPTGVDTRQAGALVGENEAVPSGV